MNHEFCGRRCARAWATDHGQPITGSLARPPSPDPNQPTIQMGTQPQNQNTGGQSQNRQTQGGGQSQNQQTVQGGNQPGQKRGGGKRLTKIWCSTLSWWAGLDTFCWWCSQRIRQGIQEFSLKQPTPAAATATTTTTDSDEPRANATTSQQRVQQYTESGFTHNPACIEDTYRIVEPVQ